MPSSSAFTSSTISLGTNKSSSQRTVSPTKAYTETHFKGVVTDFHNAQTRKEDIQHARLIQDSDTDKRQFLLDQSAILTLRNQIENAKDQLNALKNENQTILHQLQTLSSPVSGFDTKNDSSSSPLRTAERLARLATLHQARDHSEKAIKLQQKQLNDLETNLHTKERNIIEKEVGLARKVENLDKAYDETNHRVTIQRSIAAQRAQTELRSARTVSHQVLQHTVETLQSEGNNQLYGSQVYTNAKQLHKQAAAQLDNVLHYENTIMKAAEEIRQTSVGGKVQAILSLKNNLDQVANEAQAVNARRQATRKARDIAHQNEYDTLLAAGYNPYEVWRARQRDQTLAKEVKEHEEKIATQKLVVAEKVIREDEKVRRLEQVLQREKDIDDEQRRTHARPVRDAAITAYLMDKTKDHTDVMDPTGKLIRVEPSKVTILKPGGFGLGNTGITRPDIVAKVASKKQNQNVNILPHWLPKELNDEDYNDLANQVSSNQEAAASSASFALTQRNRTLRKGVTADEDEDEGNDEDEYYSGKRSSSSSSSSSALMNATTRTMNQTTAASPPLPPKPLGHTRTIEVRKLSQYEQRLMNEAKARQRANIVKKQIVLGKEYKGVGFLPSPTVIHFKDFDVHVPMTLKITLTNVSLSFNSFKLLPLPDEIIDLFTIVHTPPGRMSAGLTCTLTITFLPRQNIDIHSQLTVLAHTGPINIPLHCTTKKALPLIREPVLDLGEVILGESTNGYFTVENEGALPLKVTVRKDSSVSNNGDNLANGNSSSNSDNENKKSNDEEDNRPSLQSLIDSNEYEQQLSNAVTFSCPIDLPGYGKIKIPVHFAPEFSGVVHVPLTISFDHPSTAPLPLLVKAAGIDVPLYVESEIVDLRTCLIGKLYRGTLVVRNRGTIALRCEPYVHPGLIEGKILQFHPHTGFVQAKDPLTGEPGRFEFQIKFRPSDDLMDRPAIQECRVWEDTSVGQRIDSTALNLAPLLKVPLQIIAPDQVLPVPFVLCARIASPELVMDPDYIDFGSCIVGQAVAYPIRITNNSALPQKFGFIHLPSCFAVSPGDGDGFGLLLPGESTTVSVTFSPLGEQDYASQLICRTNMNGQYTLDVQGKGTRSSLALSHPVIFLAATAVGEVETSTVHLTNTTREALDYEIIPPISTDGRTCPVSVSPAIGILQGGQTVRLQIHYAPTQEDLEAGYTAAQTNTSTSPLQRARLALATAGESENILSQRGTLSTTDTIVPTSGVGANVASMLQEAAPNAVCDTWQLAIFSRKVVASALLEPVNDTSSAASLSLTKLTGIPPPLQTGVVLQVSTVILPRILSASTKAVAFGQVPVGHTETSTVRITNHSDITIDLSPIPLTPAGGFALVNAPRSLAPGTYHDMVIAFKPIGHRVYTDKLVLGTHSHGPIMNITMTGVGVSPQVVLDPPGCGNINFGAVCVGDTVTRKITLRNSSGFPLSFNVRQTSITPSLYSATPVPPFYVDPLEGNLAPHGNVTLSVTFVPRHAPSAGLSQNASFIIDVPNQEKNAAQILLLTGRAFDRAAYVLPVLPSEELNATSPGAVDSSIVSSKLAGDADSQEVYTLIFPQNTRGNTASATNVNTPAVVPPTSASGTKPGTKGGTAPSTAAKPGTAAANTVPTDVVNPGVIKEMIISCINRAEQNPAANTGQQQLPTAFTVHLPSTLNQGPGLTESSGRAHYFSVDVAQGNITPGNKQIIKFKFLPPETTVNTDGSNSNTTNKKAMSVGEWHEVDAKIILKGGYVVSGAHEERTVTVRLRAYVPSNKK